MRRPDKLQGVFRGARSPIITDRSPRPPAVTLTLAASVLMGGHLTAKATVTDTDVKGKKPCLLLLGGFRCFPGDSNALPELAGEGT